jgi:hypothetical protein
MQPEGMPRGRHSVNVSGALHAGGIHRQRFCFARTTSGRRLRARRCSRKAARREQDQLRRWSHALAVVEVAIALVLPAGAGLLVRLAARQSVNPASRRKDYSRSP